MNKQIILLASGILLLSSCGQIKSEEQRPSEDSTIIEVGLDTATNLEASAKDRKSSSDITAKLPKWVSNSKAIASLISENKYQIEDRLNALFLEEDFNGDGTVDVALPIIETKTNKKGFVVIHGKTFEVFVLGAGTIFKDALDDNQDYIDVWKINRLQENEPGITEEREVLKPLILDNPSIEIEASEVGGGQIYWDGKEYAYFHQTC